jgi:hypothetical protein
MYEPGGGSGEPYNRFEDLSFVPGYSVQDWIRNQMQQGNVGVAPPMGTGTPDFAQEPMYGRESPSDLQLQPRSEGPDEFIRQQLAGDVVPMSRYGDVGRHVETIGRLSSPDVRRGSMGQLSIDTMGGPKSPYLDLMDVLMGRTGIRR